MGKRLGTWLAGIVETGTLPTDSAEERLQKSVLVATALLISVLTFWWVIMYWILGVLRAAAIPFLYQVASVAGLAYYRITGKFGPFRRSQFLLLLLLPVALQWTLGGFVNSSAVMIWAFLAPLGALLSKGPDAAGPWFVAYMVSSSSPRWPIPSLRLRPHLCPDGSSSRTSS